MPGRNLQDLAVFLGNCLVSYGVMPKIRHLFCWKKGAVFFSAGRVTFDNMAGTLRDCACQKWTGFTAKDIDSCKHYANYATVPELSHGNFCYSWWRSHLLFGILSTGCCVILMSAVMFEDDVWVNGQQYLCHQVQRLAKTQTFNTYYWISTPSLAGFPPKHLRMW